MVGAVPIPGSLTQEESRSDRRSGTPVFLEGNLLSPRDITLSVKVIRVIFELLDLIIGMAFGFFHRGKEDYMGILRNGAIAGIAAGVVFVLVMYLLSPGTTGAAFGDFGPLGIILEILIYIIIFMAGTFIGDQIESAMRK
jgi:hypothetical protein